MVSILVAINAGSATETYRQNGMTHLLEHMLFNGTERRTQKQIYDEIDLIGGYNNAYTREDYTAFILNVPSRNLETGLDIQSDMLFHSTFPEEKVRKEKAIVEEEILQITGNPEFIAEAAFNSWAFKGTTYEKTTYGTSEGIKAITTEEIIDYWRVNYCPNNMTMLVVGDFVPKEMLALVGKYYGSAPPQDISKRDATLIQPIGKSERLIEYLQGAEGTIRMVLNAPSPTDSQRPIFDLLTKMLGDELNSAMREANPAEPFQISIETRDYLSGSRLIILGKLTDGMSEEKAEAVLQSALAAAGAQKTSVEKMDGAKVSLLAEEVRLLENVIYGGMFTVGDISLWGWNNFSQRFEHLDAVTPPDVDALRIEYLSNPPVMTYLERPIPESRGTGANGETVWLRKTLPNGLKVIIWQDNASRIFALHLLFENRCYMEPVGKEGIVELLHHCLTKGTAAHNGEEIIGILAGIGAEIKTNDSPYFPFDDYYLSPEYSYIRFTGLDEFWRENIDIAVELVTSDGLTEDIISGAKSGMLQDLRMKGMNPYSAGQAVMLAKLMGDSPKTRPILGTVESLGSITLEDLQEFRKVYFSPDNIILSIVTGIDANIIFAQLEKAFGGMRNAGSRNEMPAAPYISHPGEEFIKEMGSQQSHVFFCFPVNNLAEEDKIPLKVLGLIINKNISFELRERQGLAYSIGGGFTIENGQGYFTVYMGTAMANIGQAIQGILDNLRDSNSCSLTQDDLALAVNSGASTIMRRRMSRENEAYFLGYDEFTGYEPARDIYAPWYAITLDDLQRVREKYFKPDDGFFVIVK